MGSTWKRLAAHRTAVFILYCTVYLATCPAVATNENITSRREGTFMSATTAGTSFIFPEDPVVPAAARLHPSAVIDHHHHHHHNNNNKNNETEISVLANYFMPEDDCPSMYMCPSETKSKALPEWNKLNCRCDDDCAIYGDCCVNAPAYEVASSKTARLQWKCANLIEYQGLYMHASCPANWTDELVRGSCERGSIAEYSAPVTDPLGTTPITSLRSRFTYQNYYCAVCNGDVDHSVFWTPRVECEGLQDFNSTSGTVTDDYVWRNLHYNETNSEWGVSLPHYNRTGQRASSIGSPGSFVVCRLMVQMPVNVVDLVRRCRPLISECPANWSDAGVEELCHSYTAVAFGGSGNLATSSYRNVHCAVCNGEQLDLLNCRLSLFYRNVNPATFAPSFAFLFDINERGGEVVGALRRCEDRGEIFDPFFKVCRQMLCVKSGDRMRNGRCVSDDVKPPTTSTTSTTLLPPPPTTSTITSTTTVSQDANAIPNRTDPAPVAPTRAVFAAGPNGTASPSGRLGDDNSTNGNENDVGDVATVTTNLPSLTAVASSTGRTLTTSATAVDDCIRFNISRLHYRTYDNGSIFIEEYRRFYSRSDYVLSYDGSILICMPLADDDLGNYLYSRKFSPVLAYLTVAGLGVSITCLVFHLLAFLAVPFLRNLSGNNLASLCVALLVSYVTFTVSQFDSAVSQAACTSVGVILYYSFLACFFWMNAIAFDVWRTLRLATSELRISSGQQWRKFVVYSAYSWLGPALVVAASIAVENSPSVPAIFRPSFGLVACWFGNRRALLVFFVAPVVTIVLLNGVMFALSAHIIISSTQNSGGMHRHDIKARRNFRLYLRLALIMGLSWVFGIVAGQVDQEFLWYVFVVFNTLQGLFIFLSFTCTRKVRVYLRDKVFCRKPSYYASSHGAHPGRKFELEGRDSGSGESQSSQTSQTSRLSLTKGSQVSKTSSDTLY